MPTYRKKEMREKKNFRFNIKKKIHISIQELLHKRFGW